MRTLQMQYQFNGEWFDIWETDKEDLQVAWDEMDERPAEGGHIRFKHEEALELMVNGGFREFKRNYRR